MPAAPTQSEVHSNPRTNPRPKTLRSARQHHAAGNLLEAAQSYREALAADPRDPNALLGLSLIARQSNQLQPALTMARAALAVDLQSALAWANCGDTLMAIGERTLAKAAFTQAVTLDHAIAAAHFGLGNLAALREDFPTAKAHFEPAILHAPNSSEAHFGLGFALAKLGVHIEAIAAYRRAVTLQPGFSSAWLNLGVELVADGRPDLAELSYQQAIAVSLRRPRAAVAAGVFSCPALSQISALLNLGHLYRSRRRFSEAREHYSQALASASAPRLAEVHLAFCYLHLEQQAFPDAWASLKAAQAAEATASPQKPNPEIPNARGILLLAEEKHACLPNLASSGLAYEVFVFKAIAAFQEAEALGHQTAASNRGNALLRLGRVREALAAHQVAVSRNPHHPGVLYNLALSQLRVGNFAEGWPNYEIRWSFREIHPRPRRFIQPRWQGEVFSESTTRAMPPTLFVYGEQGLGDTIQFCRYLELVACRLTQSGDSSPGMAHLVFEVQPPLIRLFDSFLNDLCAAHPGMTAEILVHGSMLPSFDVHCPLLSFPAIFGTTLENVPAPPAGRKAYLYADPHRLEERALELAGYATQSRGYCNAGMNRPLFIGIAWAGNPRYRADRQRSTCLATFIPLLQLTEIVWVSLQKVEPPGSIREQIAQLPREVSSNFYDACSQDRDLADTAALIANLDLVITTDTAVAHLAGALGKPLWLLLPWQSDWRWMQDRLDTPWYQTARLFRQSSAGNWGEMMARVATELQALKICPDAILNLDD